ncbi:MAG: cation:proton antiporter [Ardenticatenaceae bacterium]|nr:cation:proton antiporter [Ardenticatenaceae bacterium]MCB9444328.1 cation:proton antiporter [Ardenticatenaceae bacterium]
MNFSTDILVVVAGFAIVALASRQIGDFFTRAHLPLISGFLLAGIFVGPFVLNLVPVESIAPLHFVDEVALGYIAFAAGSELYISELRGRFKSIGWVTLGNTLVVPSIGSLVLFLLADFIPFMQAMSVGERTAVALLGGAILLARSPSSVIAIVNELRAKGPFTQTIVGVTMLIDVIVIIVFTVNLEIADAIMTHLHFNVGFMILLLFELLLSLAIGLLVGKILQFILSGHIQRHLKSGLILLLGYGVFVLSTAVRTYSHESLPFEVLLEPLLICMIGSFYITNFTGYRVEAAKRLHDMSLPTYVAFFTLTGIALELDVLAEAWLIALALFAVRLVGIFVGSLGGGILAGDSMRRSRFTWMAFVTQAGVGLGLAKEVAVEFPGWGEDFATIVISVIVLSQIIGPPFIKWAINRVGEAHPRGETAVFDGVRDALIFGVDDQALALTRQLQNHNWQVKLACLDESYLPQLSNGDITVCPLLQMDRAGLEQIGAGQVDAIVTLLSDEENYQLCEMFYEHFGTETMVVRLNERRNFDRFYELGALIVEPGTALVSLLDHFVRSPSTASMILGIDPAQDMIDIEVCDPALDGLYIRDLRLPLDTLILSLNRDGHTIVSHGYTRLKLHDRVTVVGSPTSLEEVVLKFEA